MQLQQVKQETDRRSSLGFQGDGGDGSPRGSNGDIRHFESSPLPRDKGMQAAMNLGLPLEEIHSTFDPFKRSSNRLSNKLTSSIQDAAQMQLNMFNNKP